MFQDADDVSGPTRLREQLAAALEEPPNTLLGCKFVRDPPGATRHYTAWANSLTREQMVPAPSSWPLSFRLPARKQFAGCCRPGAGGRRLAPSC